MLKDDPTVQVIQEAKWKQRLVDEGDGAGAKSETHHRAMKKAKRIEGRRREAHNGYL